MQTTPYKPSRISLVFDANDTDLRFKVVVRPGIPMSDSEKAIIMLPLEHFAFNRLIPQEFKENKVSHEVYKKALRDSLMSQIDNIVDSGKTGEFELMLAKEVYNE